MTKLSYTKMSNNNLNNKVLNATKWSGITEIAAKLVSPITTMVLARLLTPDAFLLRRFLLMPVFKSI